LMPPTAHFEINTTGGLIADLALLQVAR